MQATDSPPAATKKRDAWDKADIVAKLVSSIVIAAIGILITWSIQRTQIATNESVARAQIDAAKAKAADERKIQEGQITVQLLNHLISTNATQRRLAIVALRQTVPADVYDAVLQVLAQSDTDPSVRTAAIAQLTTAQSPQAKETLTSIAADKSKPKDERLLAAQSSTQLAITSGADQDTFVYLATTPGQHAIETPRGGMFTTALLRALEPLPAPRPGATQPLTGKLLAERLNVELATLSEGRQTPTFWTTGNPSTAFTQPTAAPKRALVIGSGDFADPRLIKLRGPEIDARSLDSRLRTMGFEVELLVNPTKPQLQTALEKLKSDPPEATRVLFYSGHAGVDANPPSTGWIAHDSTNDPSTWLSIEAVRGALAQSLARTKWVFVDSDYSGELIKK